MTGPEPSQDGTLFLIGTATSLIRYGEMTVLTDPNFLHRGERAYLGHGLTARRLTEPAMSVEELPAVTAVVLSICTAITGTGAPARPAARHPDYHHPARRPPTAVAGILPLDRIAHLG